MFQQRKVGSSDGYEVEKKERYKKTALDMEATDWLLVEVSLEAHPTPPRKIVIGLDATDDPVWFCQPGLAPFDHLIWPHLKG